MIYCDRVCCINNGMSIEDRRICLSDDIEIDYVGECVSFKDNDEIDKE